jgi:uncharacterized protein (TIGR02996 family)
MPTAQDFHEAIIASPDDDTPRLAYADWLDEHGDAARAEFIRVQIALARTGEDDARRKGLKARERKLQDANADAWLGPPRERLVDYRFERGLLEQVELEQNDLWNGTTELFHAHPIRCLSITVQSRGLRRLATSAWLSRLAGLWLSAVDTAADGALAALFDSPHLTNLRELVLFHNDLGPGYMTALTRSGLMGLQMLYLVGEYVGVPGAEALAGWAGLAGITRLNLAENDLGPVGIGAILAAARTAQLLWLDVGNNSVTVSGARTIAGAECLSRLETLRLNRNPLGNDGVVELTRSPHLRPRRLDLHEVSFDHTAVRQIASSPMAERLGRLDLSFNAIGDRGAAALAQSRRLTGLNNLILSRCEIGPEGVRALAESPHLSCLRILCLSDNNLGLAGVEALTRSPNLGELRYLLLRRTDLDDRSAEALARWPGLARLNRLDLSQNRIGDDGARALAASPNVAGIEWLDIRGRQVTEAAAEALRAAGVADVNFDPPCPF